MEDKKISKSVLKRLPGYLAYLKNMPENAPPHISATALANALGMGEVQVRKDLAMVSDGGRPKIGYLREALIDDIEQFLCCRVLILEESYRAIAYFAEVKGAYLARHADGDTHVGRNEHVWERSREEHRLFHCGVVVIYHVNCVFIYAAENFVAEWVELGFRVTRSGVRHIGAVLFTEVTL